MHHFQLQMALAFRAPQARIRRSGGLNRGLGFIPSTPSREPKARHRLDANQQTFFSPGKRVGRESLVPFAANELIRARSLVRPNVQVGIGDGNTKHA